jgi:hypothetical protein
MTIRHTIAAIIEEIKCNKTEYVPPYFTADAIISALPELNAHKGDDPWQPIETAPTDSRPDVLLYSSDGVQQAWWCQRGYWARPLSPKEIFGTPTHWMPLPAAPTEGE